MPGTIEHIARLATTDYGAVARRTARGAVIYAVVALLIATAYVAALAALAIWLAGRFGWPMALGAIAGGALVLAVILLGGLALRNRSERRNEAARAEGKHLALAAALLLLPGLLPRRALATLGLAGLGLAGIFAGLVAGWRAAKSSPESDAPAETERHKSPDPR